MTKTNKKLMSLVVAVMYALCILVSAPVTAYAATPTSSATKVYTKAQKAAYKTAALKALAKLPTTAAKAAAMAPATLNSLYSTAATAVLRARNSGACTAKTIKMLTNYKRLAIAKAQWVKNVAAANLAANTAAAAAVTAKIALIPATVVLADEATIVAARTAYTALSAAGKLLVTNLTVLTAAEAKIVELKSVTSINFTATGAKKLTVTFSKAVDTTKALVTVKKGTVAVNLDSVTFATDKLSAVITTTTGLTKGDYTVYVNGVNATEITKTLTVADTAVSKINLLSTSAPRTANPKTALVRYEVLNQYGEAMTGQSITWTISTGVAIQNSNTTNCTFEIVAAGGFDFVPGATVYITGVHAPTATVVNGQVTIALAAQTNTVTFKGVYNTSTGKLATLPAGFVNDKYVLLYEVYDQFGYKIENPTFTDLIFTSNNPLFVLTPATVGGDITIDDVVYKSVKLAAGTSVNAGGSAIITAISVLTGKTSTFTTTATALASVKTFTLSAPAKLVAERETVYLPFTAVDQFGAAVTNYATLHDGVTLGAPAGSTIAFEQQNDGSAKVKFVAPATGASSTTDLPVYLTSVVPVGGNFSSLMISVKDLAVPTSITGIETSTLSTNVARANSTSFGIADLVVLDQYGRTMTDTAKATWINAAGNSIIVLPTAGNAFSLNALASTDVTTVVLGISTDKVTVNATATPTVATEAIKFSLSTDGTTSIAASTKTFTFTNAAQSEYTSFELKALGTMYNNAIAGTATAVDYNKAVVVYGVLANGTKVAIPAADVTVTTDGLLTVAGLAISDAADNDGDGTDNGYIAKDFTTYTGAYAPVDVVVTAVVTDTTTNVALATLTGALVVSNKAPKGTDITVDEDLVTSGNAEINATSSGALASSDITAFVVEVDDQYGVNITTTTAAVITISKLVKVTGSTFAVTGNGTATASIAGATMGDTFTATIKYDNNASTVINFLVGVPKR